MKDVFTRIKSDKISEDIVFRIKSLIKDGELQPGEKLPPERTLSEILGVGRSTLREAVNTLETLGFVEIRKRKGIFVRPLGDAIIADPLAQIFSQDRSKVLDLYELRKDIELAAAQMAAKRRSTAQLTEMETHLNNMLKPGRTEVLLLRDDLNFHMAVARAAGNFLRVHILETIFERYGAYINLARNTLSDDEANTPIVYQHHERIFSSILKRNGEEARAAMDHHLNWVINGFRAMSPNHLRD